MRRTKHLAKSLVVARKWQGIAFLAFAVFAVSVIGVAFKNESPARAAGPPFPRGQGMVFVSQGNPTRLFESVQLPNSNATTFNAIGPVQTITYNAMGFNTDPNPSNPFAMYLYAINSSTNRLIQIDSTGATTGLGGSGSVTGLPALTGSNTYNAGAMCTSGNYNILWVASSTNSNTIYSIDVSAAQPTATPLALHAGIGGYSSLPNTADFVCINGYLWGAYGGGGATAAAPNGMYRVNLTTGVIDWFSLAGIVTIDWGNSFGAQWVYGNGNIGISNNQTGNIHQIQIDNPSTATPTFTEVAVLTGPASTTNDGASYLGEPVDLSLVKTVATDYGPFGSGANNDTYTPGSNLTYTLTVTNNETSITSSGFYITDTLDAAIDPSTISFDDSACYISQAGTLNVTPTTITCVYGALAPGASTSFNFYAVSPLTIGGSVTNTATVTGNEADPVPGNNTDSVTSNAAPSGYIVSKAASPAQHVLPGETVTYTVTVTNTGSTDYTAAGVGLADFTDNLSDVLDDATLVTPLGAGLTLSGTNLNWSGELLVGVPVTVTYQVTVNSPVTGNQLLNNSVIATHDEGGCGGVCSTQTRIGVPSYSLNKTVDKIVARPGDFVTYTISITNTGTAPYTAHHHPLMISDDLSDVLDDAVFTGYVTNGAYVQGSTLYWSGPLAIGASTSISYTVRVVDPGTAGGNLVMNNLVSPSNSEGTCANCATSTPIDTSLPPLPPVTPPTGPGVPGAPNTGLWLVKR